MVFVGDADPEVEPRGGPANDEPVTRPICLMVTEKIAAAFEAVETLLTGGGLSIVIDRYREHITLNATRLAR
jgi:hypothetical protein